MNILHLIENLEIGGAQTRLVNDLRHLSRGKFNNIVCSLVPGGRLAGEIEKLGISVYSLEGVLNPKNFLKLAGIIKKNDIDVMHTQLFFADLYGRLAVKLSKIPFMVTTIQSSVYEPDSLLCSNKRKILDSFSGRLCNDKFIAVSDFVKNSIIRRLNFNPKKIDVIPNYIDFSALNSINENNLSFLRKKLDIKPQELVLITVSRLNPAKGINYLLEAFSNLYKEYASVKLIIVGDGHSREELERLSQNCGISNRVLFLREREDVKELLHMSDIFVFPTLSEGLPLSLLEAMAVGRTCIASDIGPIREIITDGERGILFRTKDVKDLERAIRLAIDCREKSKRMADNAKYFVKNKYDFKENVKLLESLYLNLRCQCN